MEAGRLWVQCHFELHIKFKVTLGSMKTCPQKIEEYFISFKNLKKSWTVTMSMYNETCMDIANLYRNIIKRFVWYICMCTCFCVHSCDACGMSACVHICVCVHSVIHWCLHLYMFVYHVICVVCLRVYMFVCVYSCDEYGMSACVCLCVYIHMIHVAYLHVYVFVYTFTWCMWYACM